MVWSLLMSSQLSRLNMKINIGSTIHFWMFDSSFTKHTDLVGRVSEIKQIEIGGKLQTAVCVAEMADKIILSHQITKVIKERRTIEQLRHVIEVMESEHIQSVEVSLEEEVTGMRVYSAITKQGFEQHCYTVRVLDCFDEMTMQSFREVKCTCLGFSNHLHCRHAIRALEIDSDKTGREMTYGFIDGYGQHKRKNVNDIPYLPNTSNKKTQRIGGIRI